VYQTISPSFLAPSMSFLSRSEGVSFSRDRQISSGDAATAAKLVRPKALTKKKASKRIFHLRSMQQVSVNRSADYSLDFIQRQERCQLAERP
jgi:hypothetical protein